MKVYVDELPKKCLECCLLSDGNFCNHDDFLGELHSINVYKEKPKNCPLLNITDYTKQVRKEVCEEIGNQLGLRFDGKWQVVCDGCMTGDKTIMAVLDQIQGETK